MGNVKFIVLVLLLLAISSFSIAALNTEVKRAQIGEVPEIKPITIPKNNEFLSLTNLMPQNTWIGMLSPISVDLDDDGDKELVFTTQPNYQSQSQFSSLYIVDYKGNIVKSTYSENCWYDGRVFSSIGDLNGDGQKEIVVGLCNGNIGSKIKIFDNEGKIINTIESTYYVADDLYGSVVLSDINDDGSDEIIFGAQSKVGNNWVGSLVVFDENGDNLPGFPVDLGVYYFIVNTPAVGDIDGDGEKEIVVNYQKFRNGVYEEMRVSAISSKGDILWTNEYDDNVLSDPVIADLDSDGEYEILVSSSKGLRIFNNDGTIYEENLFSQYSSSTHSNIAVADMNQDDYLEIVLGNRYDLYILDYEGKILTQYRSTWNTHHPPLIANVDGDEELEAIFNSDNDIFAINLDGSVVNGFPKPMQTIAYSSPLIDDVNGDGKLELFSSATWLPNADDGIIYKWDFDTKDDDNYWKMYQNNPQHTGFYESNYQSTTICSTGDDCSSGLCVQGTCEYDCDSSNGKLCSDGSRKYNRDGICTWSKAFSESKCDSYVAALFKGYFLSSCKASFNYFGERNLPKGTKCDANSLSGGFRGNGICNGKGECISLIKVER